MKTTSVIRYMNHAIMIAEKGLNAGELPIGALIVHGGSILAENYTQEQTQHRRIAHAEFLVLDAVDQLQPSNVERSEMVLFITLEPCIMCLGAAMTFGIRTIYYALESPIRARVKRYRQQRPRVMMCASTNSTIKRFFHVFIRYCTAYLREMLLFLMTDQWMVGDGVVFHHIN